MAQKRHGVVFILDASPSMNTPFPSNGSTTTRFEAAKQALRHWVSTVACRKGDVCVILCNTLTTDHIYQDDGFENLTMIPSSGLTNPNLDYIRLLDRLECTKSFKKEDTDDNVGSGNVCDALSLATQVLYDLTGKRKTYDGARYIVVFTDAEHTIVLNVQTMLQDVDTLRQLDCKITVVGMDFGNAADYPEKALAPDQARIKQEEEAEDEEEAPMDEDEETGNDDDETDDEKSGSETDGSENEQEEDSNGGQVYSTKEDCEKLLISLVEKTGGRVVAVSNPDQLAAVQLERTIKAGAKFQTYLQIAPDCKVMVRTVKLVSEETLPSLQSSLIQLDWQAVHLAAAAAAAASKQFVKTEPNHYDKAAMATVQEPDMQLKPAAVVKTEALDDTADSTMEDTVQESAKRQKTAVIKTEALDDSVKMAEEPQEEEVTDTKMPAVVPIKTEESEMKPSPVASTFLKENETKPSVAFSSTWNDDSNVKAKVPFLYNGAGQLMLDSITETRMKVEDHARHKQVLEPQVARAVRYSTDLIPMSDYDYAALSNFAEKPIIRITCYMERNEVPREFYMGQPYAITGHDSVKACAAVSALARALDRLNKVAICTYYKTGNKPTATSILGGLFPLPEPEYAHPVRLVFIQLPFANEVKDLTHLDDFTEFLSSNNGSNQKTQAQACDDLIDAFMLPEKTLESTSILNPYVRAFKETVIQRGVVPEAECVEPRTFDENDPMVTPPDFLEQATPALDAFRDAFPLKKKVEPKDKNKGRSKGPSYYRDKL